MLFLAGLAEAGVQRFAILVGNNQGFVANRTLYFSELDVKKMGSVLATLGDVDPRRTTTLLGRTKADVLRALTDIRAPIANAKASGDETILYFYYSGHADDAQLQLGRTGMLWKDLEGELAKSGADVRVAFIDACQSGTLTRNKGGTKAPSFVFDVAQKLDSSGSVIVTSSTGDEASQESDEIGGSYFTHFLASALSGTADDNADGKVTLYEAYQYVYHETVYRTSSTRGGSQHPTYDWNLSGTGDVVITELERAGASLTFPLSWPGTFAVYDADRKMFVAEVDVVGADRRLSLRPGKYLVQRRYPTYLAVAEIRLLAKSAVRIDPDQFHAGEYEDDVAKGSVNKTIRRANLPRISTHILAGGRGFVGEGVETSYFPATPAGGFEGRFNWRDGKWVSVDFLAGSGTNDLTFSGLPYGVPTQLNTAAFGVGFGWETPEAMFQLGGGLHLQVFYIERAFPGQNVAAQDLTTIAPGAAVWVGLHPGRFELEIALRTHYLPYIVDGRDQGFGFNELLLGIGYRF